MEHLGYTSCLADPDLWMRKAYKDGSEEAYWEYTLLYVDDALCVSEHPEAQLEELNKYFRLKPGSIQPPKLYLGAKTAQTQLPNGTVAWGISASKYIQDAVNTTERKLEEYGMQLSVKANAPITKDYRPEIDVSTELDPDKSTLYQSLIGSLRWMVEMGRLDIACEVSMLSSFLAMPREGHLQQVLHIFSYLKYHHNSRIVMDPTYPDIKVSDFPDYDWENHYHGYKEEIPNNVPEALGLEMVIRAFVDADHAGDTLTR